MSTMIAVKRFTLRGKVAEPGWKIRTNRPETFIQRGLARAMTNEEIRAMLDEYVAEAKHVFSERRKYRPSTKSRRNQAARHRGAQPVAHSVTATIKKTQQQGELYGL